MFLAETPERGGFTAERYVTLVLARSDPTVKGPSPKQGRKRDHRFSGGAFFFFRRVFPFLFSGIGHLDLREATA